MSWRWDWILFAGALAMTGAAFLERSRRALFAMTEMNNDPEAVTGLSPFLLAIAGLLAAGFIARIACRLFRKKKP